MWSERRREVARPLPQGYLARMEVGGVPCLRVEVLWRTEVEGALNDVISNEPSNVRRRGSPRSRRTVGAKPAIISALSGT